MQRIEDLCRKVVPAKALAADARLPLKQKKGVEKKQAEFLAKLLSDPKKGLQLCHAMLLPRKDSLKLLKDYDKQGGIDLGGASVKRMGKAAVVTMQNPRYLNAEDEDTIVPLETAVDIALLDPKTQVCVLRGGTVTHPKYAGRRLFGAGINLTHLYEGKIRYLWYLIRDFGLVNKMYRGLAVANKSPEVESIEKPWIAAVEGFAIGGHCQILLAVDYTIAAQDAYLTLPARKEGIIPGAANLRLPRFVGDRIARQAIMAELRIECDSPHGRLICDEIVPPGDMDAAIANVVEKLTSSGVVSAASNRRAFRIAQEPLDDFRRYMSVYAREQAHCHFSQGLINNLERNWKVQK
jgi:thioesterase DpgC